MKGVLCLPVDSGGMVTRRKENEGKAWATIGSPRIIIKLVSQTA